MKQALSQLLGDFLSAILFLVTYLLSGDITLTAAIAIAAGLVQFGALKFRGRQIEPMQWMSLGLVVVLSGATILTQSPQFVMLKPSVVHFAIAAVMLRRDWMIRYLPDIARQNLPERVSVAAGYGWAGLMGLWRGQSCDRRLWRSGNLGLVHLGCRDRRKDRRLPAAIRGISGHYPAESKAGPRGARAWYCDAWIIFLHF